MTQETTLSSNDARVSVAVLVRNGVLLSEIINSTKFTAEIRAEALRVMRENVTSLRSWT